MPNWVSIALTVTADNEEGQQQLAEFVSSVSQVDSIEKAQYENEVFTFRNIVPIPSCLTETIEGSMASIGYEAWFGNADIALGYGLARQQGISTIAELRDYLDNLNARYRELGALAKAAEEETGHRSWYSWCIANWGTKWDACSPHILENRDRKFVVSFDTAWSVPEPVLSAMVDRFPALVFNAEFQEPGMGFGGNFYGHGDADEANIEYFDLEFDDEGDVVTEFEFV